MTSKVGRPRKLKAPDLTRAAWRDADDDPIAGETVADPDSAVLEEAAASPRKPTVGSDPAWWVGKSREEFQVEAKKQFTERMQYTKIPAYLYPQQRVSL